jgi:serine/threonine protein kinase
MATPTTPGEWRRVRELFELALEQDPADVHRWLEQQTAREPEVRREVLSLLAHHDTAGSFLAEPLGERAPDLFLEDDGLKSGTVVGAYTIVREIGRGGMGRVYLASDSRLGRNVALKALPPSLAADASRRERLWREARAAAALTHPGICAVYAFEEIDGSLFIASEYIEGQTLRAEIAGGRRQAPHEVLETARELAAALASAHARGITHRDLKPENIMRAADGRLKILDFGLARVDDAFDRAVNPPFAARATEPGVLVGTPAYMAPEQLNGQPADSRSDVFSFGVLLYELASGVHPFEGGTPIAVAARVLESEAQPIDTLRPDVPAALASVIARCLRKAPAERWPSAVDVALALARPEEMLRRSDRLTAWWRTHQLIVMAVYCGATVIAWQIKERVHGLADPAFIAIGIAAALNGVLRGHLLFTEWMNRPAMAAERARAEPITLAVDLVMALVLAACGALVMPGRPLAAMLTIALATGIVLARTVLEPATAAAVFGSGTR